MKLLRRACRVIEVRYLSILALISSLLRIASFVNDRYNERMALVKEIREKVAQGAFEFSQHAVDQMLQRHISVQEVREAIGVAEIIEDYPSDKYGPSCLILGITQAQRPIHAQCSYPSRLLVKIITVYQPDTDAWIDFKQRRIGQ